MLTSGPTWPPLRISGVVNDGEDVNQIISYNIENAVGEPGQQCTSNIGNDFRIQQRYLFQPFHLKLKRNLKLRTQPLALSLVPLVCLPHLADSTPRKLQAVRHDPFFSCALT